ncbi:SNARE associated family protein [Asticcacaulis biprosthecium C19]|uniref:TVP38/TMEM64 family membrane protein n=1 Tax=Asticcacaulis biprosthecium C19 TaxID=715226 RepID=F4QTX6_9CAUL|nr:VTT domain-containing protein [Asticcacaulis biprosthecium]EGF89276.1 SNARE associated family protein [Asticcacaulis biprosthecium C19]
MREKHASSPIRLWLILAAVVVVTGLVWHYRLGIEHVKLLLAPLEAMRAQSPWLLAAGYLAVHVLLATLCAPLEILLAVMAGALFGPVQGAILASFGSSIGGTLAFSWSRWLLRDRVRAWFPRQAAMVDRGMARDGVLYLVTLRLLPVVPFFLVNLLAGLTPLRTRTFYVVTQASLLPAIFLYANAGTQLAQIKNVGDILSPSFLAVLTLLAVLPWLAKWGLSRFRR